VKSKRYGVLELNLLLDDGKKCIGGRLTEIRDSVSRSSFALNDGRACRRAPGCGGRWCKA
jgi:hypothetical protein